MAETVSQYVLRRLKEIGFDDVFGVAGDYAFPVNDAIVEDPALNWISCCNELNAAYAADGYARMRGVAALCTTYGVSELAAMSGVAGAYAERLPVFIWSARRIRRPRRAARSRTTRRATANSTCFTGWPSRLCAPARP
jgi:TPP-dependent 2-oxoacid decarboxylase